MSMVKLCFAMLPSKQGFSSLNESIIKNYFPQCIKCIKYCNLCTCRYTHLRWCRSANRVPTPMHSMGRGVCSSCEHWDPLVCVCVEMMTMFYHMICLSVLWRQLDRKKNKQCNWTSWPKQRAQCWAVFSIFLFCTYFSLFCVSAFAGLYSHVSQICNGDERISLFALRLPKK